MSRDKREREPPVYRVFSRAHGIEDTGTHITYIHKNDDIGSEFALSLSQKPEQDSTLTLRAHSQWCTVHTVTESLSETPEHTSHTSHHTSTKSRVVLSSRPGHTMLHPACTLTHPHITHTHTSEEKPSYHVTQKPARHTGVFIRPIRKAWRGKRRRAYSPCYTSCTDAALISAAR